MRTSGGFQGVTARVNEGSERGILQELHLKHRSPCLDQIKRPRTFQRNRRTFTSVLVDGVGRFCLGYVEGCHVSLRPIQDHRSPCFDQTKRQPTFHFHLGLYFLASKSLDRFIVHTVIHTDRTRASATRGHKQMNPRESFYRNEDMGVCFIVCTVLPDMGVGFLHPLRFSPLSSLHLIFPCLSDSGTRTRGLQMRGMWAWMGETHTQVRSHPD